MGSTLISVKFRDTLIPYTLGECLFWVAHISIGTLHREVPLLQLWISLSQSFRGDPAYREYTAEKRDYKSCTVPRLSFYKSFIENIRDSQMIRYPALTLLSMVQFLTGSFLTRASGFTLMHVLAIISSIYPPIVW